MLSIISWNIGFSRRGQLPINLKEFCKSFLGFEKTEILETCREITVLLQTIDCDFYSIQEICSASVLNSWVPVRKIISHALPQHSEVFLEDFRACLWATQCFASHGQSLFSRFRVCEKFKLQLPQVQTFNPIHRFKNASANVVRLNLYQKNIPITIVGVHLSAIDDRIGTKQKQIEDILKFAELEYLNNRYVIICGDFNYCVSCIPDLNLKTKTIKLLLNFLVGFSKKDGLFFQKDLKWKTKISILIKKQQIQLL